MFKAPTEDVEVHAYISSHLEQGDTSGEIQVARCMQDSPVTMHAFCTGIDAVVVVVQPQSGQIGVAWQEALLVPAPSAMAAAMASLEGDDPLDLVRAARQVSGQGNLEDD